MPDTHRLDSRSKFKLADCATKVDKASIDRHEAEAQFTALREELVELQQKFYADSRHALLIIFQAMDAGGKDGAIRHVFKGVNPQGVRVTSFKAPTSEEFAHHYLWRISSAVPARGMIGVFNRSQYEDVLVVRVEKLVPEKVWRARYEHINQFEKMLVDEGTTILKFYLHISKGEQRKRLQERLTDPHSHWKFSPDDLVKRRAWDDYQRACEDALVKCSTPWAPWHVIPADQKWYRNLAVAKTIVETLRRIDPRFPPPPVGLDKIVIE